MDEKTTWQLEDLQIQSFVTELDEERLKAVRGGDTECPDNSSGGGASNGWCTITVSDCGTCTCSGHSWCTWFLVQCGAGC